MTILLYRVECNHGSKYFKSGIEAFYHYEDLCEQEPHLNVELWLIVKDLSPKLYSVKQELIAYRSVGGYINPNNPTWH